MTENTDQVLIDLLIKQATEGLTDVEQAELDRLERGRHDNTFDVTVSAISLIDERGEEPMPSHLRANIRAAAERFFDERKRQSFSPLGRDEHKPLPRSSFPNWLGWAVAACGLPSSCSEFLFHTSSAGTGFALAELLRPRRKSLRSQRSDKNSWPRRLTCSKRVVTKGSMTEISDVTGDIVWSDSEQKGM
jgi:hypothetical protein